MKNPDDQHALFLYLIEYYVGSMLVAPETRCEIFSTTTQ